MCQLRIFDDDDKSGRIIKVRTGEETIMFWYKGAPEIWAMSDSSHAPFLSQMSLILL